MNNIRLLPVQINDLQEVLRMQRLAFAELLEKYRDYDTNPGNETVEDILRRFHQNDSTYYFILSDNIKVGVIRIIDNHDGIVRKRISPLFILPEYQGRGYAQKAIALAEQMHGTTNWSLTTILQEPKNCHLYEKCGYRRVGKSKAINDRLELVFYEKD